jgi:Arc/MetJ-type ribon-helix-helix transcriptional regulator
MTGSALERAYDLARTGRYRSVSELIRQLPAGDRQELEAHLMEHGARRDLILVCGEAWLATK